MKKGIIDISQLNTPPEKHELRTAKFFSDLGKDVVFIKPSNIPEDYRPDIYMDGIAWEIKCPTGKGKRTIEKNYHKAALQSKNIIFDLRRIQISDERCMSQLKKEYADKHTTRLLVITGSGELVTFSRDS